MFSDNLVELLECFCRCCNTIILTIPIDAVGDIASIKMFAMERGLKARIKILGDKFQIILSKSQYSQSKAGENENQDDA